jgi:signal transduction histidine kinase
MRGLAWRSPNAGCGRPEGASVPDSIAGPTGDMLVALSRAVTTGRLLSGVVHEVNNALLVISGTVELLEGHANLPEPVVRGLDRLRRQSARAAAALGDVTSFTQASLDDTGDVELRSLTQAAVDLRRFAATRAGISLQFDPGDDPCLVRGNSGYLQQAILNLILNAEAGMRGTKGIVTVEVGMQGDAAAIRVSDERLLKPGHAVTAFEPFDPSRPANDISGLTLYAARAIAEAHSGTLTLDEQRSAATSYVIRVPKGY